MEYLTTRPLSKKLKVSIRTIQILAKDLGIQKTKGKYLFDKDQIKQIQEALKDGTKRNEPKRITQKNELLTHLKFIKEQISELEFLIKNF